MIREALRFPAAAIGGARRRVAAAVQGPDAGLEPKIAGSIRAAKLNTIIRLTPLTMSGNLINALVLAYSFRDSKIPVFVFGWCAVMVTLSTVALIRHVRRRRRLPPKSVPVEVIDRLVHRSVVIGCAWSFVPLMLFYDASESQRIFLVCALAGTISLAGFALAPLPVAALSVIGPIVLASATTLFAYGDATIVIAGGLVLVFGVVLARSVTWYGAMFTRQLVDQAQLTDFAQHDTLTGLANRRQFLLMLNEACDRLAEGGGEFAIVYLDLDGFKTVNDSLGHMAGDRVLKDVGERLCGFAGDNSSVARLGGDEFAFVMHSGTDTQSLSQLCEAVIAAMAKSFNVDGITASVGISLGIARAPDHGREADQLMRNADLALYRAKKDGRGTYRFFEASMDMKARERRSLEFDLRQALHLDEFSLHFQPIKSIRNGTFGGCEALVRWDRPGIGTVLPADFILVAEESGLIGDMGRWILREACACAASWPDDVYVAVNLSAIQFRGPDVSNIVADALDRAGLAPQRLVLEVTESALMDDLQGALANLLRLRAVGVRISLDDFGTGYSSLSYLEALPFDKIKIDQAFISRMEETSQSLAIVRAIISLARTLGADTCAEGIETESQLRHLAAEGCTEAQGYLIGRPRSAEATLDFLRARKSLAA